MRWINQVKTGDTSSPATQQGRILCLLAAVIAVALWLRLWGIGFGLPYDLTYDEPHEVLRALKLGAGEYYWERFGKGGLYYLLFVEYGVLYVVWWMLGWVKDSRDFAVLLIQDPSVLYLAGRLTVVGLAALTCVVVFVIGKRIYDWRVGIGAALIGATAYSHGVHSHMINVDIGMALAMWTSIWAYLVYEERTNWRWLIGAGILAGVAIAHKTPGAIVLLPLFLAMGSRPDRRWSSRQTLQEMGIVFAAALVTLTVMAPEWILYVGQLLSRIPFRFLQREATVSNPDTDRDMSDAVVLLVTRPGMEWTLWLQLLFREHNIVLSATALIGAGLGLVYRFRWDVIWTVLIITFLGILAAADRLKPEYYLLPIMPGFWLLGSRALVMIAGRRQWVMVAGFLCVIALPLYALIRQNSEWTQPDTRVVAKEWIEANIPSGAKILMDGMQHRFVQSPPLTPNEATVARRINQVPGQKHVSRGVSQQTLSLYEQALTQVERPKYELHSTVWGLKVRDPDYYIQACFDYIITSSDVTKRYLHGIDGKRYPRSARFYERLMTHPRFEKIYAVEPVPWERGGPAITVYKVAPTCEASLPVSQ